MHIRWRGLELPSTVVCDAASLTPTYGKFVVEPFERGFGATIGNGLRRILLSSLEGSAGGGAPAHGDRDDGRRRRPCARASRREGGRSGRGSGGSQSPIGTAS